MYTTAQINALQDLLARKGPGEGQVYFTPGEQELAPIWAKPISEAPQALQVTSAMQPGVVADWSNYDMAYKPAPSFGKSQTAPELGAYSTPGEVAQAARIFTAPTTDARASLLSGAQTASSLAADTTLYNSGLTSGMEGTGVDPTTTFVSATPVEQMRMLAGAKGDKRGIMQALQAKGVDVSKLMSGAARQEQERVKSSASYFNDLLAKGDLVYERDPTTGARVPMQRVKRQVPDSTSTTGSRTVEEMVKLTNAQLYDFVQAQKMGYTMDVDSIMPPSQTADPALDNPKTTASPTVPPVEPRRLGQTLHALPEENPGLLQNFSAANKATGMNILTLPNRISDAAASPAVGAYNFLMDLLGAEDRRVELPSSDVKSYSMEDFLPTQPPNPYGPRLPYDPNQPLTGTGMFY